jgi:hypothetical protein
MLFSERDQFGITVYTVCNDQGVCLIRTTDGAIARFVHHNSFGVSPDLRLRIGGDKGAAMANPLWRHVRRFSK